METLETLRGNTKTLKLTDNIEEIDQLETKSKRFVPSTRWCFTAYNDEIDKLWNEIPTDTTIKWYVMGREICPTTGRPHLQGFIESLIKIRPTEKYKTKDCHWEKTKRSNDENYIYCRKLGEKIPNELYRTNMVLVKPVRKQVLDPLQGLALYAWQTDILTIVKEPVDPRKIYWFWESEGCTGKSTIAKHICMNYQALSVGGKGNDIKYAVATYLENRDLDVLIYDVPRNIGNVISYSSIEEIKNGCMFNNKYESGMRIFNSPHIIIFSNFPPELEKLSSDRWIVQHIGNML